MRPGSAAVNHLRRGLGFLKRMPERGRGPAPRGHPESNERYGARSYSGVQARFPHANKSWPASGRRHAVKSGSACSNAAAPDSRSTREKFA